MADHHHHQNHGLKQAQQVVVVMVPFPAQGHLNQLLQLSRLVSSYNIPVHYVSCATHNRQAKLRVHGWNPLAIANVHFHEYPTTSFLSPIPNPNSSIPFPSHLQPAFDASFHLREPVATLLRTLSPTAGRLIVIHDSLMSSVVQDVVSIPNAESYTLHSVSAFAIFLYLWETMRRPFEIEAEIPKHFPLIEGCFTSEFTKFINSQHDYMKFDSGRLYNTCQVMEGPYLDLLAREEMSRKKKQWAFGPFNPVTISDNKKSNHRHKCLKWLDKQDQPKNTVLITKLLKVGLVVKDWARRDELVTSLMVEKDVKKLMASKEGDEIRRRAAELGGAIRRSVAEGGQSRMELDSFITHITR
ncbi:hypothetical protein F0562_015606 [Nyssa sinensis]|uniref:Glycosyltransferase N-terminal domain-containing protein n=1 Tax=Nyssa sinensis TaxID=561372 RepID=A0A5J4ZKU3_9ASTE|nr:hypothetical protein F0562_015606 [Nyssa sinensis]